MKVKYSATAGTHKSRDIMITIEENQDESIATELDSSVKSQFGEQI